MSWFTRALRKYAVFSGRARRKEFWMFALFVLLLSAPLAVVDVLVGTSDDASGLGLFSGLFMLATFVPYLAVTARRLHDIGKSGWLQLLFLIPLVGFVLTIVWMAKEGDRHANAYGPDPKLDGLPA